MNKKTIFRPELSLEMHLDATSKRSKLCIRNTNDIFFVLEGIKELTSDHLVIVYLDENDVVVGVESFLNALDRFDMGQATRAMSSAIVKQNRDPMTKVIIAQTLPDEVNPNAESMSIKQLANFAIKLLICNIEFVDCILMGRERYFSYKEDPKAWEIFQKELAVRKELFLEEPFFPAIKKKDETK